MGKKICLEAVKENGDVLRYVSTNLKDYDICLEAVKNNGLALKFVQIRIINKEICLEAVKNNDSAIKYVHSICGKTLFFHKVNLDSFNVNLWLTLTECSKIYY